MYIRRNGGLEKQNFAPLLKEVLSECLTWALADIDNTMSLEYLHYKAL